MTARERLPRTALPISSSLWPLPYAADVSKKVQLPRRKDFTEHAHDAARHRLNSRERAKECRLARTVGSDQPDEVSAAQIDGDVIDGDEVAEAHAQRISAEDGIAHR